MPQDSGTEETRSAQDLKETSRGHLVSLPFICLVLVFYLFIYFLNCHKSLLFDSREPHMGSVGVEEGGDGPPRASCSSAFYSLEVAGGARSWQGVM